jgi:hypothetical protein
MLRAAAGRAAAAGFWKTKWFCTASNAAIGRLWVWGVSHIALPSWSASPPHGPQTHGRVQTQLNQRAGCACADPVPRNAAHACREPAEIRTRLRRGTQRIERERGREAPTAERLLSADRQETRRWLLCPRLASRHTNGKPPPQTRKCCHHLQHLCRKISTLATSNTKINSHSKTAVVVAGGLPCAGCVDEAT